MLLALGKDRPGQATKCAPSVAPLNCGERKGVMMIFVVFSANREQKGKIIACMYGRACVRVHVQALPTVHGGAHSVWQLRHNLLVVVSLLLHLINKFVILKLSGFLLQVVCPDCLIHNSVIALMMDSGRDQLFLSSNEPKWILDFYYCFCFPSSLILFFCDQQAFPHQPY